MKRRRFGNNYGYIKNEMEKAMIMAVTNRPLGEPVSKCVLSFFRESIFKPTPLGLMKIAPSGEKILVRRK